MMALVASMDANHPGKPVLVLSNVADAGGLAKAQSRGINTAVVEHRAYGKDRTAFEAALHDRLVSANIDIICLAGFMRILSPNFVSNWTGRMLNIHPSLLPKYKGLHTHSRAISAGDKQAGCSVHELTAELDGGPVLGQTAVDILPEDTADDLAAKVLTQEHILYPMVLRQFIVAHQQANSL